MLGLGGRRRPPYDRSRLLAKAARARRRGRPAKAIACYREVLAAEPRNADVLRRLAPLLARTKQGEEAWSIYRRAAEELAKKGFCDRAIGVYREAAGYLPREIDLWLALAGLELERERRADAAKALREGRTHFSGRRQRSEAMRLLDQANRIEPSHPDTVFDLAALRARCGQRRAAVALLDGLLRDHPHRRLRIRARQLRIAPGPATLRLWLGALLGR